MRGFIYLCAAIISIGLPVAVPAQGTHFSQYYHAPMLLSPANTGLMPDNDYRVAAHYRNQWSTIPATFNTVSAFADFQLFRSRTYRNWLGLGLGFFNDRAGQGNLSLSKVQLSAAYHLQLNDRSMLSAGIGAAWVQRSVDFSRLTFDVQWDGFRFNPGLANGEDGALQKTQYPDIAAGINYAFFPNPDFYLKIGIGVDHINMPRESFYNQENKIGRRITGNVDALFRLSDSWIAETSGYYTWQKGASELLYGVQFSCNVTPSERRPNILIMGAYHRWQDAVIPVAGFEWNSVRLLASVDVTHSSLAAANHGNGAFEISLIYKGLYHQGSRSRDAYNCPRF